MSTQRNRSEGIDEQTSLWGDDPDNVLASPKVRAGSQGEWGNLMPFFAAFSEAFARSALLYLAPQANEVVFDPFVGCGTTLHAHRGFTSDIVVNDINPVSIIFTRAKAAYRADLTLIEKLLTPVSHLNGAAGNSTPQESPLPPAYSHYLRALRANILDQLDRASFSLPAILGKFSRSTDSVVVAIAAVMLAVRYSGASIHGSNPVWHRFADDIQTGLPPIRSRALECARRIVTVLHRGSRRTSKRPVLLNSDILEIEPKSIRFDVLLTSPPYLNRLDYVVNHKLEFAALQHFGAFDQEGLRDRMIGTTTMTSAPDWIASWSPYYQSILRKVETHPSYASSTYYLRFFLQYGAMLREAMRVISSAANPGARGFIVVQNSYYKEVPIELAQIVIELARSFAVQATEIRRETVRLHLGKLSPRQSKYAPDKTLYESIIRLNFP